jgi:hypothetical protein
VKPTLDIMATQETTDTFCRLLVRIFNAAAYADGVLHEDEKVAINEEIVKNWSDFFNVDKANIWMESIEAEESIQPLLEDLKEFKSTHHSFLTEALVERIMQSVSVIVSSHAKRNKSEVILLSQLHLILRKK